MKILRKIKEESVHVRYKDITVKGDGVHVRQYLLEGAGKYDENATALELEEGTVVEVIGCFLRKKSASGVHAVVNYNGNVFSIDAGLLTQNK